MRCEGAQLSLSTKGTVAIYLNSKTFRQCLLKGRGRGCLEGPVGCNIVTIDLDLKELRHRFSLSVSRRLLYFSHIAKQNKGETC